MGRRGRSRLLLALDEAPPEVEKNEITIPDGQYQEPTSKLAYCELILANCGDVDCGRCEHLARHVESRSFVHSWRCSACVGEWEANAYWTDGRCETCGDPSSLLILATPPL